MNGYRIRNILYVSHTADLRGSAMSLRELMVHLPRDRFQPHGMLSKHGPFEDSLRAAEIPMVVMTDRGFLKLKLIAAARSYLREHTIDLVHLNSAVPFCRDVGIAAKLEGINGWRQRLGIGGDEFIFVIVGTIEERKGQHLLVEAANGLLEAGHTFRIIIVGAAMIPEDKARLGAALESFPRVARITHCLGRQADIPPILRASNCLVLPSTWEGFPRTVAEGMACGLPVITTPVGELPYMIEDTVVGLLVPPNDITALRAAMQGCLQHETLDSIAISARHRACNWSSEAHVAAIESLYESLLLPMRRATDGNGTD